MCETPAIGPCASCGRARCAGHLQRGLCDRCTQAIERQVVARAGTRLVASSVTAIGVTVGMLAAHTAVGLVLGLPLSFGMFFALRWTQRRRLIKQMGPSLSASKGELPVGREAPEPTFPEAPPVNPYISSGGW